MGFLDKLFKQYPKREEWHRISQSISEGFFAARTEWFNDYFVKHLRAFVEAVNKQPLAIKTDLTPEIDRLMKAFQLHDITTFLASSQYLPNSQASSFCDLFWAQVCGPDMPAVMNVVGDLEKCVTTSRYFHLGRRVAQQMIGEDTNVIELMYAGILVAPLPLGDRIAVAAAFDDKEAHAVAHQLLDEWFATGFQKAVEDFVEACKKIPIAA